jgi:hypothetical protein
MQQEKLAGLAGIISALLLPAALSAAAPQEGACIRLRHATLDTSAAAGQARAGTLTAPNKLAADCPRNAAAGRRLPFIIQFTGPVQPAWKQAVEQTGAQLGGYLPDNAFIAELTPDQIGQVADLACVQWVGPYKAAYKLDPPVAGRLAAGPKAINEFTLIMTTGPGIIRPIRSSRI